MKRSYVSHLKKGRIDSPSLDKMEAIARAMGFPPALWFGDGEGEGRATDDALLAALEDETLRSLLEEAQRMRPKDRRLLLEIARQISPPPESGRPWRRNPRRPPTSTSALPNASWVWAAREIPTRR